MINGDGIDEVILGSTIPHVNNLMGEIFDIEAILKLVHQKCPRALLHMTILYSLNIARQELIGISVGLNHFFIPLWNILCQYEIGCLNHEACADILDLNLILNESLQKPDFTIFNP
ncbi:unnamed protein product [Rotaria sordida]|uniref:Uncharacterized protein n=1 Tax=Rotaria sordida TaxID=392033 RepID=A0A819C1N4_9BILA|nr:unnamed protein product [Rotaria sordida]